MENQVQILSRLYTEQGGVFLSEATEVLRRIDGIKAYVFDWDGVFNTGAKNFQGTSDYNEIDSMGINMLRFSHWLRKKHQPVTSIISGEKNSSSFQLGSREHFTSCYYKIANKTDAFEHFCAANKLKPGEIAFIFDDILDLSIAEKCGLRILINRPGVSMVKNYVIEKHLADYITSATSGHYALRETCEMIIGLTGNWNTVLDERVRFSPVYQTYLQQRNEIETTYYSRINQQIEEANP
jgi:3-deoxy-D-manno-octulosonate 8-phosphate phosphatase (KDO 8-P phosphatase)